MDKAIIPLIILLSGCIQNEYEARGELYQCFIDGKPIYVGNDRPEYRGDVWWVVNGDQFQADSCFCMGCIGF